MYAPAIFLAVLLLLTGLGVWLWLRHTRAALLHWAQSQGYDLVHYERRWLRMGPFIWKIFTGILVFRVVVKDTAGHSRRGYVGVGGGMLGFLRALLDRAVDVRWDDEGLLHRLVAGVRRRKGVGP